MWVGDIANFNSTLLYAMYQWLTRNAYRHHISRKCILDADTSQGKAWRPISNIYWLISPHEILVLSKHVKFHVCLWAMRNMNLVDELVKRKLHPKTLSRFVFFYTSSTLFLLLSIFLTHFSRYEPFNCILILATVQYSCTDLELSHLGKSSSSLDQSEQFCKLSSNYFCS